MKDRVTDTPFRPLHRDPSNPRPEPSPNWADPLAALSIPVLFIVGLLFG